jgi:hypothetical protein
METILLVKGTIVHGVQKVMPLLLEKKQKYENVF